ncbi:MAG: hypothetical protein ACW97Z_16955 [Candidatus Hodarchaeales archaeon]|jgi:hypothetical protein
MSLEELNKYSPVIAVFVCFLLDIIVIMVLYWPLTVIAAIIGSLFCVEMKWGAISGTVGVLGAWILSFIFSINDITLQADQLGRLLIDSNGAGGVIVLLIFIVGALFGFLGGSIGSGIRMLALPENAVSQED